MPSADESKGEELIVNSIRDPQKLEHPDAISYQEILDADAVPPPPSLRERSVPDLGTSPVPVVHYTDPEFFRDSIDKMWSRTWLMACREEEIPAVGDYHIFEVVGKSLIIVRTTPDEIKALHNICLHRGRKLVRSLKPAIPSRKSPNSC